MFLCVQDAIIIPTSRDTVEDIYDRTPNHREIYPFAKIMTLRACLKSFDKREGKADNKGKQGGDDGECVNIQAISVGKSMKRYERI